MAALLATASPAWSELGPDTVRSGGRIASHRIAAFLAVCGGAALCAHVAWPGMAPTGGDVSSLLQRVEQRAGGQPKVGKFYVVQSGEPSEQGAYCFYSHTDVRTNHKVNQFVLCASNGPATFVWNADKYIFGGEAGGCLTRVGKSIAVQDCQFLPSQEWSAESNQIVGGGQQYPRVPVGEMECTPNGRYEKCLPTTAQEFYVVESGAPSEQGAYCFYSHRDVRINQMFHGMTLCASRGPAAFKLRADKYIVGGETGGCLTRVDGEQVGGEGSGSPGHAMEVHPCQFLPSQEWSVEGGNISGGNQTYGRVAVGRMECQPNGRYEKCVPAAADA
ncbi:unnamed protein product [Prorocentrum cordatum]|uniref:Ricin B lectin domain-containing protein n=1 Tax=Prorocentrum cordatum TaxID=2364126 RepID=A0ABN9U2R1_9DINO|nr:unnamed protein product [Polarella glacialis]